MNDFFLLRQYEPVVRYTQGEMFFPCAVDAYLAQCSLWRTDPGGTTQCIVPQGNLTPGKLASCSDVPPGHTLYLRYVEHPLEGLEYQRWRRERPTFLAAGRLARVGLGSRIIDSFFDLSLLVRGRVPGGTAAAAYDQYNELRQDDPRYVYYGRVVRTGGYIVLHYMYFYVMNNWRSTFYGVNDHEGDWEQIFVYLSDEADPQPVWVAYAAHDETGDDLRRHWDDPQLRKVGNTHPIIYAGAGSHASYFEPGEYLTQFRLQLLEPLRNAAQQTRAFWNEQLQQGNEDNDRLEAQVDDIFNIPFIDYARGDGLSIGAEQPHDWTPVLIDDHTEWTRSYRGLWGLDTRDPFGGERAPAGPRYNRDGTVRQSWHNPLGWSGLDKVAPPQTAIEQLQQHIQALEDELDTVQSQIQDERENLRLLDLEVRALWWANYMDELHSRRDDDLQEQEAILADLHTRAATLNDTLSAARGYLERVRQGDYGDPRRHIEHLRTPMPRQPRLNRVFEFWAALSTGLLFVLFALSIVLLPGNWLFRAGIVVGLFIFIEATLRGRLPDLLLNLTLILASVTVLVLVIEFFWLVLLIALLALARLILDENLRELRERG